MIRLGLHYASHLQAVNHVYGSSFWLPVGEIAADPAKASEPKPQVIAGYDSFDGAFHSVFGICLIFPLVLSALSDSEVQLFCSILQSSSCSHPFDLSLFHSVFLVVLFSVGAFELNSMNLAMGFALGCCMQFYGSVVAYLRGEFIPAYAFAAYAFFWFSFGMTFLLPVSGFCQFHVFKYQPFCCCVLLVYLARLDCPRLVSLCLGSLHVGHDGSCLEAKE